MAPKKNVKGGYSGKSDGSDDSPRDDTARGSNDPLPEDATLEDITELVKKMSLETLETEKDKLKKQAQSILRKMAIVESESKKVSKEKKAVERKEQKKTTNEKKKADAKAAREATMTITFRLADSSVSLTQKGTDRVGFVRALLCSQFNLKKTTHLSFSINGVPINTTPWKTLRVAGFRDGDTVDVSINDNQSAEENADDGMFIALGDAASSIFDEDEEGSDETDDEEMEYEPTGEEAFGQPVFRRKRGGGDGDEPEKC